MGEKFKKLELNSEIWGEWGVTHGENGLGEKFKKKSN